MPVEGGDMADLQGAGSNHLAGILKKWNVILQDSSLGRGIFKPVNESKDGNASRDAIRPVGRKRKAA